MNLLVLCYPFFITVIDPTECKLEFPAVIGERYSLPPSTPIWPRAYPVTYRYINTYPQKFPEYGISDHEAN